MVQRTQLELDLGQKKSEALYYARGNPDTMLSDFLRVYSVRASQSLPPEYYSQPLKNFQIVPVTLEPQFSLALTSTGPGQLRGMLDTFFETDKARGTEPMVYPERLSDNEAVQIAYGYELGAVARYLANDLSVLIISDKILTEHIFDYVCKRAGKTPVLDDSAPSSESTRSNTTEALDRALQGQAGRGIEASLPLLIRNLKENQVLVLRSVEALDSPQLIEVLYQGVSGDRKPQLLGFLDPSLEVKKVLTNRFAVHYTIMGLPRYIKSDNPDIYTVKRMLTSQEHASFKDFDPEGLYKNVSGLNAIQFRNAMRYVGATVARNSSSRDIYEIIRRFKTSSSDEIEIPDTGFDDIGGYERVKQELKRIVTLATGHVVGLDERERQKLIPRGFIFHGPPGTGKTLFAKAIANEMNATIQMVSGPEIMDKYVGQSESNLRHIFATARRNAPSVIFFDEFDSIASQRSTYSDGGSRANNAVVAQLLTELDGFREDQAVLVIGTTNRLDIIDEALLRPSRLRPIEIGQPDYVARRSVASIHAGKFGVDALLRDLCELVLEYLSSWNSDNSLLPGFLEKLFTLHPALREIYEIQMHRTDFFKELQPLFTLIKDVQTQHIQVNKVVDPALVRIEQRLVEVASKYDVNFTGLDRSEIPDDQTTTSQQSMQHDLLDLFGLLQEQTNQIGNFSSTLFMNSILDLIAEYTEGFNNDEIRAIFQEASLEYHLEGQLITPRYLGMKIGLIRKRRDERQVVHLSNTRR